MTDMPTPDDRPEYLPEKFWDGETGAPRLEDLAQSYTELEQRFTGQEPGASVPETADDYAIEAPSDLLGSAPEINAKLHQAGFSQEQAQLVYNMADEFLVPLVTELAADFEAYRQIDRLAEHFGGADKWRDASQQIETWARKNLGEEIFGGLSKSYEGVLAMQRMMMGEEPKIGGGNPANQGLNEADLKRLMADPRYWRDKDPALVEQVRNGFDRLYPG